MEGNSQYLNELKSSSKYTYILDFSFLLKNQVKMVQEVSGANPHPHIFQNHHWLSHIAWCTVTYASIAKNAARNAEFFTVVADQNHKPLYTTTLLAIMLLHTSLSNLIFHFY